MRALVLLPCLLLAGCPGTIPREPPTDAKTLVIASCPDRPKLQGETFGDWTSMAFQLAALYDVCSAAALGRVTDSKSGARP